MEDDIIIVGNLPDNPFAEDIAHYFRQEYSCSDVISLKEFLNSEFCPRFLVDEDDVDNVGNQLAGKVVIIVSTSLGMYTRGELAMRNCLIARAAKDNGADKVFLIEPDLFYSAQDRGPRPEHGVFQTERNLNDYKKFDGQPFSARLYADLLKKAGVDEVLTVHNHSYSVKNFFMERFSGHLHNLQPAHLYATYIKNTDIASTSNLVLCAPDKGAMSFVHEVHEELGIPSVPVLQMSKVRSGEREVAITVDKDASDITLDDLEGKDVIIIDDMVRTGSTIVECCRVLKQAKPNRVLFFVTHFYANREGRSKLNDDAIDEIVTTNTIPQILNRDTQGRLRYKMVVLRVSRWITKYVMDYLGADSSHIKEPLYIEDMSSKNPRWKSKVGPLFAH